MLRLLVLLIFLLQTPFSSHAVANPLTKLFDITSQNVKKDPVHPLTLTANWWDYFNVDGEEFEKRVKIQEELLTESIKNLPEEEQKVAESLIKKIIANLNALPEIKNEKIPEPVIPARLTTSYSIEELMEIYRAYHAHLNLFEEEQEDIKQKSHATDTLRSQYDTELAAYLAYQKIDHEKILHGLKIMSDGSALALANEQLRVKKLRLESAKIVAADLQSILDIAKTRITTTPEEIEKWKNQINIVSKQVIEAQNTLIENESHLLELYADTSIGRARASYAGQIIVEANIQLALAKIDLMYNQIGYYLQLYYGGVKTQRPVPEKILWLEEFDQLKREAREWQKSSEREFMRANEDLSASHEKINEESKTLVDIEKQRVNLAVQSLNDLTKLKNRIDEVDYLQKLAEKLDLLNQSPLTKWSVKAQDFFYEMRNQLNSWINISLFKIGAVPVTPFGLFRAIFLFILALMLSRLIQYALKRIGNKQWRIAKSTFYTLGRLAHYLLLLLGFVIALASIGLDFSNLALVAGALSVGIGFGLQSIVNNVLSGLIILFEKTLKIGDFLELESGYSGYISEINVRSTILRTNDGIEVIIPNSEIISNKVVNWTLSDAFRRVHVPFTVPFGTDKELVKKLVLEAADRVPHTLKGQVKYRPPEVQMTKFGDNGLCFDLVVWVDARASKHVKGATADYLWEIDNVFRQHNIKVPLPQLDVHR